MLALGPLLVFENEKMKSLGPNGPMVNTHLLHRNQTKALSRIVATCYHAQHKETKLSHTESDPLHNTESRSFCTHHNRVCTQKQGEEETDQYDATWKIWSIDSRKIAVSTVFMSYDFSWRFNTTILHGIRSENIKKSLILRDKSQF
jgi:hypothetical protein